MKPSKEAKQIENEARAKCLKMYPIGSILTVRLRENWREMTCEIRYQGGCNDYKIRDVETGKTHNFFPSIHAHSRG